MWSELTTYAGKIFWNMNVKNHSKIRLSRWLGKWLILNVGKVAFQPNTHRHTLNQGSGGRWSMTPMDI